MDYGLLLFLESVFCRREDDRDLVQRSILKETLAVLLFKLSVPVKAALLGRRKGKHICQLCTG